jgi:hypothetical protein
MPQHMQTPGEAQMPLGNQSIHSHCEIHLSRDVLLLLPTPLLLALAYLEVRLNTEGDLLLLKPFNNYSSTRQHRLLSAGKGYRIAVNTGF